MDIREEITNIFKRYGQKPKEGILTALTLYVEHEKDNSRYDGAMSAIDKIRDSMGLGVTR